MNIVLEANLAGATVTREDGAFFVLGSHNPETLSLWKSEDEIRSTVKKLSSIEKVWQFPTQPELPTVSPVEFKLLFTSAERVKLKELRSTDPILDDFWSIVDDPRATQVRLGLTSTQQGVAYAVSLLVAAGTVDPTDEAARIASILSGTLQ